jgi:hypothetical protein
VGLAIKKTALKFFTGFARNNGAAQNVKILTAFSWLKILPGYSRRKTTGSVH